MTEHIPAPLDAARLALASLTVYRGLRRDPVLRRLGRLLGAVADDDVGPASFLDRYAGFYHALAEHGPCRGLADYVAAAVLYDDNAFARAAAAADFASLDRGLVRAAEHDLRLLARVAAVTAAAVKEAALRRWGAGSPAGAAVEDLPEWNLRVGGGASAVPPADEAVLSWRAGDWDGQVAALAAFHRRRGAGPFARYRGFVWERHGAAGALRGVTPDPVRLADLVGYEDQHREVVANTLHLLAGLPANNVLLYGDRGTGKSSTVKALVNEYHDRGLRIIEIPKALLADFPAVVRAVRGLPQKFIIFIDDLAFEDNEAEYTALKAVLEGGLESRPENVAIYATSNRRHLVKEYFGERAGLRSADRDDEVRAGDTVQEKLSLADRFGITVVFPSPDQKQYLEIVEGLAARRVLAVEPGRLRREALRWAMWHNGRSPRTARQFVDWLEAVTRGED